METKTCCLGDWDCIPGGSVVTAVILSGERRDVDGAHSALKLFCEHYIQEGVLTAHIVYTLHFTWIKLCAEDIECPTHLPCGIDLILDGSGNTPLMRMNLLATRLKIPSSECMVEYVNAAPVPSKKLPLATQRLVRWRDADVEPECSIQKRLHEVDIIICSNYVPYKLSIGNDRFVVNGWDNLVEVFVLWVLVCFPNGIERIKELKHSRKWNFKDLCKIDYNNLGVSFSGMGVEWASVDCMQSLMELLSIDRYSVYVKCAKTAEKQIVSDAVLISSEVEFETSLPHDDLGAETISERNSEAIASSSDNLLPVDDATQAPQKIGRHFMPAFRMLING